jgi:hypothetical protein
MVSVAAALVSMLSGSVRMPLRSVCMPRLRSACEPAMVAPRSLYVVPTAIVAGLDDDCAMRLEISGGRDHVISFKGNVGIVT